MIFPSPSGFRLLRWFVAYAIGPAAILAVIAYLQVARFDRKSELEHLATVARSRAAALALVLEVHGAHARLLAQHPDAVRLESAFRALSQDPGHDPLYAIVDGQGRGYEGLDAAGVARLREGDHLFQDDRLLVGAPRDDGRLAIVSVPIRQITGYLSDVTGLGSTGETFLVDREGRIRAGGRGEGIAEASVRPPGQPGEYLSYRGREVLGSSAPVGSSHVVAEIEAAETTYWMRALAGKLLGLGAAAFLVVMGALFYAGNRVQRSVEAVVAAIESAAQGRFGEEVTAPSVEGVDVIRRAVNEAHRKLAERDAEILRQRQELFCQRCELERLNAEIIQADRMKSEFVANMSHEVRTPLHSILSLSDILLQQISGPLGEEQKRQVGIIQNNGRRLHEMLGDILDFSKIEAGKMVISAAPLNPASVLAGVREAVASIAESKGLRFILDAPEQLPTISSDAEKLHRILLNLAHNAVKFTQAGIVTLSGRARPGGGVELDVRDTGPGIPAHQMEHLFQPFKQLDGSMSRTAGGTGLGLSIARSLTELLGGRISVESKVGEGTVFRVSLPESCPARGAAGARPSGAERELLVIGASPASGEAVRSELRVAGFEAGRAICGRDVRRAFEKPGIGAVLLDVGLFTGEGLDSFGFLGERLIGDRVPVIPYWLDVEGRRGGLLGGVTVRRHDGALLFEAGHAPPLAVPDRVTGETRRQAIEWYRRIGEGPAAPFHEVMRLMVAQLERVLRPDRLPEQEARGSHRDVLLIDRDPDARYSMTLQLEQMGHRVRAADEVAAAPDFRPEIVLLEPRPGEAGEAVAKARALFGVPVVVLTADARAETRDAALASGASAFLTKPIPASALARALALPEREGVLESNPGR